MGLLVLGLLVLGFCFGLFVLGLFVLGFLFDPWAVFKHVMSLTELTEMSWYEWFIMAMRRLSKTMMLITEKEPNIWDQYYKTDFA